ncbi:hypothetical protein NE237_015711 [Protea cynaroides]|uniref:Uncharacterized protein n=1 Tax=Protea cynaroides TaxID=273540 RepID=A0A9Q0QR69_9MAGN|nr:hypothetical protein NE237_015711 [Protea cynaroides]
MAKFVMPLNTMEFGMEQTNLVFFASEKEMAMVTSSWRFDRHVRYIDLKAHSRSTMAMVNVGLRVDSRLRSSVNNLSTNLSSGVHVQAGLLSHVHADSHGDQGSERAVSVPVPEKMTDRSVVGDVVSHLERNQEDFEKFLGFHSLETQGDRLGTNLLTKVETNLCLGGVLLGMDLDEGGDIVHIPVVIDGDDGQFADPNEAQPIVEAHKVVQPGVSPVPIVALSESGTAIQSDIVNVQMNSGVAGVAAMDLWREVLVCGHMLQRLRIRLRLWEENADWIEFYPREISRILLSKMMEEVKLGEQPEPWISIGDVHGGAVECNEADIDNVCRRRVMGVDAGDSSVVPAGKNMQLGHTFHPAKILLQQQKAVAVASQTEFARKWVSFYKKFSIEPRAPETYFSLKMDYLKDKVQPTFVKECQAMKREYEEFKVRINALVAEVIKVPPEGWIMQDGTPWPGNNTKDHPGMIQVFLAHSGGHDIEGNELPCHGIQGNEFLFLKIRN